MWGAPGAPGRSHLPLTPIFLDGFSWRGGTYLRFTRDNHGFLDGFSVSAGRVWGVRFDRMRR